MVRIDLHPRSYSPNNTSISSFLKQQINILEKQYASKVSYFCARERNTSDKEHYHLALFFSGHKIRHTNKVLPQIKQAWEKHSSGTANLIKSPYYMMYRGDKSSIDPVIYRLSYLTKNHTKELNKTARSYLNTRVQQHAKQNHQHDNLLVDHKITYEKKCKVLTQSIYLTSESKSPFYKLQNLTMGRDLNSTCRVNSSLKHNPRSLSSHSEVGNMERVYDSFH
jgi:hypothetical protein